MSETDYNSILKRLFPREDGEPPLKYRKGICAGVGSGVIDVSLSGVIIPDVPIHGTASMNDEVHLLTDALGRMLAIGECGGGGGSPGDLVCEMCALGDLANVDTMGQAEGDMLWYDGTTWILVGGTKTPGNVPTVQGDGTVTWQAGVSGNTVFFRATPFNVVNTSGSGAVGFTDVDVTTQTDAAATGVILHIYFNSSSPAATNRAKCRQNGVTTGGSLGDGSVLANYGSVAWVWGMVQGIVPLDGGQVFEYAVDRSGGSWQLLIDVVGWTA